MKAIINILLLILLTSIFAHKINNNPENTLGYKKLARLGATDDLLLGYKFIHFAIHSYTNIERGVFSGEYKNKRVSLTEEFKDYAKNAINFIISTSTKNDNFLLQEIVMKEVYLLEDIINELTKRINIHNALNSKNPSTIVELSKDTLDIPIVPEQNYDKREKIPPNYPNSEDYKSSDFYKKLIKLGADLELIKGFTYIHDSMYQLYLLKLNIDTKLEQYANNKLIIDNFYLLCDSAKNYILSIEVNNESIRNLVLEIIYSLDDMIIDIEKIIESHNRIIQHLRAKKNLLEHTSTMNIPVLPHQNYIAREGIKNPYKIILNEEFTKIKESIPLEIIREVTKTDEYHYLTKSKTSRNLINEYCKFEESYNKIKEKINMISSIKTMVNFDDYFQYAETRKFNFLYRVYSEFSASTDYLLNIVNKMDYKLNYFRTLINQHNKLYKKTYFTEFSRIQLDSNLNKKVVYPKFDKFYSETMTFLKESKASSTTIQGMKYIYESLNSYLNLEIKLFDIKPFIKINIDDYLIFSDDAKNFIIRNSQNENEAIIDQVNYNITLLDNTIELVKIIINRHNSIKEKFKDVSFTMDKKSIIEKISNLRYAKEDINDAINNIVIQLKNKIIDSTILSYLNLISESLNVIDDVLLRLNRNSFDSIINLENVYDYVSTCINLLSDSIQNYGFDEYFLDIEELINQKITEVKQLESKYNKYCNYCKEEVKYEIPPLFKLPPMSLYKLNSLLPIPTTKADIDNFRNQLLIEKASDSLLDRFSYIEESLQYITRALRDPSVLFEDIWDFSNVIYFTEDAIYYLQQYETSNENLKKTINTIIKYVIEQKRGLEDVELEINNCVLSKSKDKVFKDYNFRPIPVNNLVTKNNLDWKKIDLVNAGAKMVEINAFEYTNECFKNISQTLDEVRIYFNKRFWTIDICNTYCNKAIQYLVVITKDSSKSIKLEVEKIKEIVKAKSSILNKKIEKHNSFLLNEDDNGITEFKISSNTPEVPLNSFENHTKPADKTKSDFFIDVDEVFENISLKAIKDQYSYKIKKIVDSIIGSLKGLELVYNSSKEDLIYKWDFNEIRVYYSDMYIEANLQIKLITEDNIKADLENLMTILINAIEKMNQYETEHNTNCKSCDLTYIYLLDNFELLNPVLSKIQKEEEEEEKFEDIIEDKNEEAIVEEDIFTIENLNKMIKEYEVKANTDLKKYYYTYFTWNIDLYIDALENLDSYKKNGLNIMAEKKKGELIEIKENIQRYISLLD